MGGKLKTCVDYRPHPLADLPALKSAKRQTVEVKDTLAPPTV